MRVQQQARARRHVWSNLKKKDVVFFLWVKCIETIRDSHRDNGDWKYRGQHGSPEGEGRWVNFPARLLRSSCWYCFFTSFSHNHLYLNHLLRGRACPVDSAGNSGISVSHLSSLLQPFTVSGQNEPSVFPVEAAVVAPESSHVERGRLTWRQGPAVLEVNNAGSVCSRSSNSSIWDGSSAFCIFFFSFFFFLTPAGFCGRTVPLVVVVQSRLNSCCAVASNPLLSVIVAFIVWKASLCGSYMNM